MNNILLISYYFPPCGGAPVQRWLRFIKELSKLNYNITVLCPKYGLYPYHDDSLIYSIGKNVAVSRIGGSFLSRILGKDFVDNLPYGNLDYKPHYSLRQKFLVWVRLNLIIPDVRVLWIPSVILPAYKMIVSNKYKAVITTGPPHSTHLVGLILKLVCRFNWISDFRDPWTKIHYNQLNKPGRLATSINNLLECLVLRFSNQSIVVSDYISQELPNGKKTTIYNGYDLDDFASVVYDRDTRFRIKYVGQLTAGQDIISVLDAIESTKLDIEFSFIGTKIDDLQSLSDYKNLRIITKPFLSHVAAIKEMINSECLLLVINSYPGSKGMLTTKLFEYIASKRPILCIGNTDSEAAKLIIRYSAGYCVEYENTDQIVRIITELYKQWETKEDNILTADTREVSSHYQTQVLTRILEDTN